MNVFLLVCFGLAIAALDPPCDFEFSVDISDGLKLPRGDIEHQDIVYTPNTYFKHNSTTRGCICLHKTCVRKCCPYHSVFHEESMQCVDEVFDHNIAIHIEEDKIGDLGNFTHFDFPNCQNGMYALTSKEDKFFLQHDGRIYKRNSSNLIEVHEYCVDIMKMVDNETTFLAVICYPPDPITGAEKLLRAGMIISVPFLLITFGVYVMLPEKRNLHGKCLMSYVFALMIAYICLVSIQLGSPDNDSVCKFIGILTWFFFLVSFSWVNVISYDIWKSFKGMRSSSKRAQKKRFYMYSAYAWLAPLGFLAITIPVNEKAVAENSVWHYGMGIHQCWFKEGLPTLIYFYMPMAILIAVNLGFFIATAIKIKSVKRETAMLKRNDSCKHQSDDRRSFQLYFKLLLAMGLNWVAEIVSWGVNWKYPQYKQIWYVFDLFNALYGVFIFFLFVYKEKTWRAVKKRYDTLTGKTTLQVTSQSDRTGSISLNTMESEVRLNPSTNRKLNGSKFSDEVPE